MVEEFIPENLTVSGPMIEAYEIVTLKAGEKVKRGEILAKSGTEYVTWVTGDENLWAKRIASEDADATTGALSLSVFKGGNFNFNGLTMPDGVEASAISDTLWINNIHIETNISGGI